MSRYTGVDLSPLKTGATKNNFTRDELPRSVNSFRREALPTQARGGNGSFGGPGVVQDMQRLQMPGGALLEFNLEQLTLADFRAMRQHYQLSMNLNVLAVSLHQVNWKITGGSRKARDFITSNLHDVWTELALGAAQAYWAGYSPMVLDFENDLPDRRVRLNKVKDLIPERCSVNYLKVPRNRNAGETGNNVERHNYIYNGIKQYGVEGHIAPESTLWYPVMMENGLMTGRKLLKPAFMPWFFSQLMNMYQNRYFERFGEPIIVGRAPFDAVVDDANGDEKTGKQIMDTIVSSLKNHTSAVLPSDRTLAGNGDKHDYEYTVDFLDSQMRGADFDRVITHYDEAMSLSMFTPILLFRTADVGSYSLGQAHENIFYHMVNMLVEDFSRYLNKFVIPRMVAFNFSEEMARDMRFEHRKLGIDKPETLRAIAQALVNGGVAKPKLDDFGIALGMPFEAIEQVKEEGPGTAQSGESTRSQATAQVAKLSMQIADRALGQFSKAESEGKLQDTIPDLGFKRQFIETLISVGASEAYAKDQATAAFGRAHQWMTREVPQARDAETLAASLCSELQQDLVQVLNAAA